MSSYLAYILMLPTIDSDLLHRQDVRTSPTCPMPIAKKIFVVMSFVVPMALALSMAQA
jgi:hypothetical protein